MSTGCQCTKPSAQAEVDVDASAVKSPLQCQLVGEVRHQHFFEDNGLKKVRDPPSDTILTMAVLGHWKLCKVEVQGRKPRVR